MELPELVRKVLEYRGFSVSEDSVPPTARRGEDEYAVIVLRDIEDRRALDDVGFEGRTLVISLQYGMEPAGDLFWSREDFESMLGGIILEEALGESAPRDIISSFEDAFTDELEPVARVVEVPEEDSHPIIELIPFHTILYSISSEDISDDGIVLVDAMDGQAYVASSPFRQSTSGISYERKEPSLSSEKAMESAIELLVSLNRKEVENIMENGDVTVVEKKVIGIAPDDVNTRYLGLIYVPVSIFEEEGEVVSTDSSGMMGFRKHY